MENDDCQQRTNRGQLFITIITIINYTQIMTDQKAAPIFFATAHKFFARFWLGLYSTTKIKYICNILKYPATASNLTLNKYVQCFFYGIRTIGGQLFEQRLQHKARLLDTMGKNHDYLNNYGRLTGSCSFFYGSSKAFK